MKNTLQVILFVIAFLIIIDIFGFAMWVASGQQPVDGIYVGTLTNHMLKAFLSK